MCADADELKKLVWFGLFNDISIPGESFNANFFNFLVSFGKYLNHGNLTMEY